MLVIRSRLVRRLLRVLTLLLIPGVVLLGAAAFPEKQYAAISFAVAVLACVLFVTGFEQRRTGTRRLVLAAVMTALASLGRLVPVLKPVTALIILGAMYLGAEAGFLVGAMTAVLTNFYFGQGPWTPFQMIAWGGIGLLAGLLGEPLRRHKVLLLVYGILTGVSYSLIMDIWTMLWYGEGFSMALYLPALVTAIPHTVSYALSNAVYLLLLIKPFSEKLGRIRVKYAI